MVKIKNKSSTDNQGTLERRNKRWNDASEPHSKGSWDIDSKKAQSKAKEASNSTTRPGKKRDTKRKLKAKRCQNELDSLLSSLHYVKTLSKKKPSSEKVSEKHSLSIEEAKSFQSNRDFRNVKPMKVLRPSAEEFKEPIRYIEQLYQKGAWKYGCVKIIPPDSFRPPFSFDTKSTKRFQYRSQVLENLIHGKPFDYNKDGITYEEFRANAKVLEDQYLQNFKFRSDENKISTLQKDYWDIVEEHTSEKYSKIASLGKFIQTENNKKTFTVEYAADLPTNKYGSGFPTKEMSEEYGSHPWNFRNINNRPDSLLQFWKDHQISGINIPWLYIGMLYSSFCWHYEDIMMYSINYMHEGFGKMWYAIPPQHRTKFERVARQKLAHCAKEDSNFLLNINSMICPSYLADQGVTVYSTLQKPGEFILTFPESYHAGFSAGLNVAEAVNFAAPSWLKYAEKAMDIYLKSREKIPVFPLQWIAIENLRNSNVHLITDVHSDEYAIDESTSKSIFTVETFKKLVAFAEESIKNEILYRNIARNDFSVKLKAKTPFEITFKPKNKFDEADRECFFCINLWYASFLECSQCKIKYCSFHGLLCKWKPEFIKLNIRYSDNHLSAKLKDMKKILDEAIEKQV